LPVPHQLPVLDKCSAEKRVKIFKPNREKSAHGKNICRISVWRHLKNQEVASAPFLFERGLTSIMAEKLKDNKTTIDGINGKETSGASTKERELDEKKEKSDKKVELQVQTPRGLWNKKLPANASIRPVYDKTAKIQQIIDDARTVFKFVENDNKYALFLGEQQLEPNRTIVSYHLEDETLLVLSVQGGNA